MKCSVCGKQIHYCSSCSPDYHADHNVCSSNCLIKSDNYLMAMGRFKGLWKSLNDAQKKLLIYLVYDSDYNLEDLMNRNVEEGEPK